MFFGGESEESSLEEGEELVSPSGSPWDAQEQSEILAYIPIDYKNCIGYQEEKAGIEEGLCFDFNKFKAPFRWEDLEEGTLATHLAVSQFNVMYLKEKHAKHVLNPCPPCCCCNKGMYKEDFEPKVRKVIPFEKITDIEVHEAGSNELVRPPKNSCGYLVALLVILALLLSLLLCKMPLFESEEGGKSFESEEGGKSPAFFMVPLLFFCVVFGGKIGQAPMGCDFPPKFNPVSMELPVSQTFINTAGSQGPELIIEGIQDANSFRRMVMDLKRGGGGSSLAPKQQGMSTEPATLGTSSEIVALLRDIANSRRQIAQLLQKK